MASIEETILRIVGDHLGLPAATLHLDMHLERDLGADSMDRLELIMTVEELFRVKIADDRAASVQSIADIVDLINQSMSNHAQARPANMQPEHEIQPESQ